jgi:Fe-S oxidoreductase
MAAIVQDYQHLFREDAEWRERAERQGRKMIDFTTFIDEVAQLNPEAFQSVTPKPVVTIHDACQSSNALGLGNGARRIVSQVLQLELREMQDSSVCCGFGGSFAIDYPQVSTAILGKKLNNAEDTAADVVISDNPGCIMQLRGGLIAQGSPTRVLHLAELMAERLPR